MIAASSGVTNGNRQSTGKLTDVMYVHIFLVVVHQSWTSSCSVTLGRISGDTVVPTAGLRCRSSGGYVCGFSCHSKPDSHFLAELMLP